MSITSNQSRDGLSLALEGMVSGKEADLLLRHMIGNMNAPITINMAYTDSLDRSVMHILRATNSVMKRYGQRLSVINAPSEVIEGLNIDISDMSR